MENPDALQVAVTMGRLDYMMLILTFIAGVIALAALWALYEMAVRAKGIARKQAMDTMSLEVEKRLGGELEKLLPGALRAAMNFEAKSEVTEDAANTIAEAAGNESERPATGGTNG